MKTLVISLLIFILIIGSSLGYQLYTKHIIHQYIATSRKMDSLVEENQLKEAEACLKELKKDWEKRQTVLTILVEHDAIDSILELFTSIESFFRHPEVPGFYQANDMLQFELQQMIEKNRLTLGTIL